MPLIPDSAIVEPLLAASVAPRAPETRPVPVSSPRRGATVADVLAARRTVRDFRPDPVGPEDLAFVLSAARSAVTAVWPGEVAVHGEIEAVVATRDGFRTWSGNGLSAGPEPGEWPEWSALQQVYANAPTLLLVCSDALSPESGPVCYRSTLTAVSTFGYAAWLAALSIGLQGAVFGRTTHDVTAALRASGRRSRHLFTVAIGQDADLAAPR